MTGRKQPGDDDARASTDNQGKQYAWPWSPPR